MEEQPVAFADDHPVTEQLGDQLDIGRFTATSAGSGELEQGLCKLAVLDGFINLYQVILIGNFFREIIPAIRLVELGFQRLHHQRFLFRRTYVGAYAAAGAVERTDLYAVLIAFESFADRLKGDRIPGQSFHFVLIDQEGADAGMGTYVGTLVALDAFISLPLGYVHRDPAFFIFRSTGGECTIFATVKGRYLQVIAPLRIDGFDNILDEFGDIARILFGF